MPAQTRALVRRFVLPGILALRVDAAGTTAGSPPIRTRSSTQCRQFRQIHPHDQLNQQGGGTMTTLDDEQEQLRSNLDLIGRQDISDLEAVFSVVGHYDVEGYHRVPDNCPAEFTWDYEKGAKPKLDKLYEKAKKAQWNAQTDLDWSIEVDQERVVMANAEANPAQMRWDESALVGTALEKWDDKKFSSSGSRTRTGCCRSSCTASRGRSCARPRSWRRCHGSTPSTTRRRR